MAFHSAPHAITRPRAHHVVMARRRTRVFAAGAAAVALALSVTACAKTDPTTSAAGKGSVKVVLTDAGCAPSPNTVEAGPTTFAVTNEGANAVSEAELKTANGQSILGERENISPGLAKDFSLTLQEGTYRIYCPGAKQDTWTFTVRGGKKVKDWRTNPALVTAVHGYADYVNAQAETLLAKAKALAVAVDNGDIAGAKAAYVDARIPYERIEPVAESFGDLDPRIDGRLGDNGNAKADFIGFHRIERALWVDKNLDGMTEIANGLVDDIAKLQTRINERAKTYEPNEVTNGARELLEEVLTSKITGEEERYSHIDLVDFQANFDGSLKTIDLLRPALKQSAPDLLTEIDAAAAKTQRALNEFKATPGYENTGFVEWSCAQDDNGELPTECAVSPKVTITLAQRRALTDAVTPLATLLSQVPVKVTR